MYCKARDEEIRESKKKSEISLGEKTKYLDSEKEAFVQSYLQNLRETHSMVTETSDSGITTHGAPSDLDEMEDVSAGKYNLLSEVMDISQLSIKREVNRGGYLLSHEGAESEDYIFISKDFVAHKH